MSGPRFQFGQEVMLLTLPLGGDQRATIVGLWRDPQGQIVYAVQERASVYTGVPENCLREISNDNGA